MCKFQMCKYADVNKKARLTKTRLFVISFAHLKFAHLHIKNYSSLLSLATGMFICSRYLATVLRAIL
jgi:hypothetical protein